MNAKGAIVCPVRPITVGGLELLGQKPGLIVYVKTGSAKHVKEFFRYVNRHELDATPAGRTAELEADEVIPDAWEVLGDVAILERLTECGFISASHYILSSKPPRFSAGSGEHRAKASKPKAPKAKGDATSDYQGACAEFATVGSEPGTFVPLAGRYTGF